MQLVNVPVMLHCWGTQLYGEWLLVSTIPAYLLLSDLGFGSVAGSDMTMLENAGDRKAVLETFQSVAVMVLVLSIVIGAILVATIFTLPIYEIFHVSSMTKRELRLTLMFLCANYLLVLQWGTLTAAFRCAGKFAIGMLTVNVIRILEGASFVILIVYKARPEHLAMLMLGIGVSGTIALLIMKRILIPWLPLGVQHVRVERILKLIKPALSYMGFPAGNAIGLQGITMVVGMALGPMAVALYSPMRTLSRSVYQLTDPIKNSVWQELSSSFGRNDIPLARKIHRVACQMTVTLALIMCLILALTGQRIFSLWTHDRIVMDYKVFVVLLMVVFFEALWNVSSSALLASNRHNRLAVFYMIVTSMTVLAAFPLAKTWGVLGATSALLAGSMVMCFIVIHMSMNVLAERWSVFARSLLNMDEFRVMMMRLKGSTSRMFVRREPV
jgi:O-antigen/teichoic acid export membrane protein